MTVSSKNRGVPQSKGVLPLLCSAVSMPVVCRATSLSLMCRAASLSLLCSAVALISLGAPVWAQSIDSTSPTPLEGNLIQGEVEPGGQSYYYTFEAGPGDLNVAMDGETDFYSTSANVILTDDKGRELSKVTINANGNGTTKSAIVHLARRQLVRMQVMFGVDVGVHIKYKVRLNGPLGPNPMALANAGGVPGGSMQQGMPQYQPQQAVSSAQQQRLDDYHHPTVKLSREDIQKYFPQVYSKLPPQQVVAQQNTTQRYTAPAKVQQNPQVIAHSVPPVSSFSNTSLDLSGSRAAASGVHNQMAPTIGTMPAAVPASSDGMSLAEDNSRSAISTPIEDKWAFVVGVSKFAKPGINLKYPAKDAKDLASYLVNEANFAPDHVKLLVDEQATKERVLAELGDKWLPRLAHPNDLVLIFISTHGSPSQADLEGLNYLVMHNTDPSSLYATGLPLSDLAAAVKHRVHSNRVVLIIDACHSGAAEAAKGLARVGNVDSVSLAQGTGQLFICSSQPNQLSWESKRYPNGVFTHQLIEALRAQSGKASLSQAFERLKDSVQSEVLEDRSELQTAVLKSKWSGNDLIISAPPTKPRSVPPDLGDAQ